MGTAHLTDAIHSLTVAVWDGDVSAAEWRNHLDGLARDSNLPACRLFLADIRGAADLSSLDDSHIEAMASRFAGSAPVGSKVAIVASHIFDGAQKYQRRMTLSSVQADVFLDVATACRWLNVDLAVASDAITNIRSRMHSRP